MDNQTNEIRIKSWSDLCERVYDFSWQADLGRYRTDYAFRGVSDVHYPLESRFQRVCGKMPNLEYHLLRNYRKYAQIQDKQLLTSEWRTMTIGQHYGLPTRLLDWSYSPFVAIHFATAKIEDFNKDGVVWQIDFKRANALLPEIIQNALKEAGSNSFTIEMLEEVVPNLKSFDNCSNQEHLLFFEPPSIDSRIINQFAFFSVMNSPVGNINKWLEANRSLWRKIVIPKELKWEIRDKLDQSNITERLLFPGLEGLASWLQRHYTPKNL